MKVVINTTLAVLILTATAGGPAMAQDDLATGKAEFEMSSSNCHGTSGNGNGPMAQFLNISPADLTVLKKNNNGEYPFPGVFQTIDGRTTVRAHGEGAMPIWGNRYRTPANKASVQPYADYTDEQVVRARVLELTYYIQSLQQ